MNRGLKTEYNEYANYEPKPEFSILYAILFLLLGGLIFFNSEIFAIKDVEIKGNRQLLAADLLRTARLNLYKNIFQVNCSQIKDSILQNPQVASANVYYQLPNRIIIEIKERSALCLLMYEGNLLIIGEDSIVMGIKDENEPIRLPIVTGITLKRTKIGAAVTDPEFQTAYEILKFAGEDLRRYLSEIDLRNYLLYIDLPNYQHTLKVELGNGEEIEEKIAKNLRSILSNTTPDELSKIDLRVTSLPTAIKNVPSTKKQ